MVSLNRYFSVFLLITTIAQPLRSTENSTQAATQKQMLKKTSASSNFHICNEITPLMKACEKGTVALSEIKQLIKDGAHVNDIDYWEFLRGGTTVIGYAILGGSLQVINELLQAGADPNGLINRGVHLGTSQDGLHVRIIPVLTYAISQNMPIEIIQQLVEAGADVNAPDPIFNMVTPLIVAATQGQPATVKYLLEAGAKKELKNCHKKTALDYALEYKQQEVIALLDAQDLPSKTSTSGE